MLFENILILVENWKILNIHEISFSSYVNDLPPAQHPTRSLLKRSKGSTSKTKKMRCGQ